MTLRGRLVTAFLVVVLGPVLFGTLFAGVTGAELSHRQTEHRLNLAATAVRTAISALCQQLRGTAGAIATMAGAAAQAGAASQLVERGDVDGVLVADAAGKALFVTSGAPLRPWTDCAGSGAVDARFPALAARVELTGPTGAVTGAVWAAHRLDDGFVAQLATATGTAVTLAWAEAVAVVESEPAAEGVVETVAASTESSQVRDAVLVAARRASGGHVVRTAGGGRYVRRVPPAPGQPLPLVLSVPPDPPWAGYPALLLATLVAGLLGGVAAWRLARSTTRPLAELASAADRVAHGDLEVRFPVRASDEVGRLASSFNQVTREARSCVRALAISRELLRGQLAVLGDTLASTHDLDRILRVILQAALAATGARAGLVLLLDPDGRTLVSQCAEGLAGRASEEPGPERAVLRPAAPDGTGVGDRGPDAAGSDEARPDGTGAGSDEARPDGTGAGSDEARPDKTGAGDGRSYPLQVPVGRGLLGGVAATGEPVRGSTRRDRPVLAPGEPCCETYLAVPFSVAPPDRTGPPVGSGRDGVPFGPGEMAASGPSVTSGVLALYDRLGADGFDGADLETVRTFAGHAAIAVGNVLVHEEAQRLSLTDPLTGLWNYRYLRESLRREVERASRFGRTLGVLALDLDRFKDINDTHGHAVGDAVLAEFARRVRGALREVDLAFRRGGEEFVVLLPETDARGAGTVAERLGAVIRDSPFQVGPLRETPLPVGPARDPSAHLAVRPGPAAVRAAIQVTVSIGIAVYPTHGRTGPQVLDAADGALYAAKAAGRDTHRTAGTGSTAAGTGTPAGTDSTAGTDHRMLVRELAVPAAARSPMDGLPRAGGRRDTAPGGALSGPHPPRQGHGR